MEGLHGELRRLSIKSGRMNTEMATGRPLVKTEIVTDPDRVEALKQIAQAYNSLAITVEQARALAAKV